MCKAAYSSSYVEWAAVELSLGEDDTLTDAGLGRLAGQAQASHRCTCSIDPDSLFSLLKGQTSQ